MSQVPPTRRRWFQFGIGTMLSLVASVAICLGWVVQEMRTVRERQRLRLYINDEIGGFTVHWGTTNEIPVIRHVHPTRAREMLIVIPEERVGENEAAHLRAIFPEGALDSMSPKRGCRL